MRFTGFAARYKNKLAVKCRSCSAAFATKPTVFFRYEASDCFGNQNAPCEFPIFLSNLTAHCLLNKPASKPFNFSSSLLLAASRLIVSKQYAPGGDDRHLRSKAGGG